MAPTLVTADPAVLHRDRARSTTASLIRTSRARAGLSQADLAARADTSQPAIARYESGAIRPRSDTLERILVACNVDPTYLTAPGRPLLGPVGAKVFGTRHGLSRYLHASGCTNVLVTGSVAEARDTEASVLEIALSRSEPSPDTAELSSELTKLVGHPTVVTDLDYVDTEVLRGARALL